MRGRWFAVGVALIVATLGVGCGDSSADEAGNDAAAGDATHAALGGGDRIRELSRPDGPSGLVWLTARETQVVQAIADGATTIEVAQTLGITPRTVESHLLNAYRKLGVHSRVQLVRLLARGGHLRL